MGENNSTVDETEETAEALCENAGDSDAESGTARENPASAWLDQSAEYVRQFDYKQANASVREYIGQNPGRCLLMAGGAGLIIGAILQRR